MATVDSVGIMHPAYFVGRSEILEWLNTTLQLRLTKIEETASGAVACQVFDILFPTNVVQMSKVNWGARAEWEFVGNYKILQAACDKIGVDRKIEVDRLIKARAQDNLEFLQWLKKFYDDNSAGVGQQDYDVQARRNLGKGATSMKWCKPVTATASTTGASSALSPSSKPSALTRPVRSPPKPTAVVAVKAASAAPPVAKQQTTTTSGKENTEHAAVVSSLKLEIDTLRKSMARIQDDSTDRVSRLELTLKQCESERDYYFGKLQSVELVLKQEQEKKEEVIDGKLFVATLSNILYDDAVDEQQRGSDVAS